MIFQVNLLGSYWRCPKSCPVVVPSGACLVASSPDAPGASEGLAYGRREHPARLGHGQRRAAYVARRESKSALEKKHLSLLICLLFVYSCVSVDFLQNYELVSFYPFGVVFSSLFLMVIVYAILKYSLFQSKVVTSRQIAQTVANTAQMIAHDIQVPFNILKVTLEELKEVPGLREKIERHVARVDHSRAYVEEILQDLLDLWIRESE